MTLTIDLTPELERRLQEEAARHGQAPAEYVRAAIVEKLAPAVPSAENAPDAGPPHQEPYERSALARQGMPVSDRWPPGYFEQTFGSCEDDPLTRLPQGTIEAREPLA